MQTIGFQEAVEKIIAEDPRYHSEGYVFLRDALEATVKRRKKTRKDTTGHVSAAELLDGFRLHALDEYGPMAIVVLDYWGIHSCQDVGNMVFLLINAGAFGKTENDTPESFRDGYDFQEAFVHPFRPEPKNLSAKTPGAVGNNT